MVFCLGRWQINFRIRNENFQNPLKGFAHSIWNHTIFLCIGEGQLGQTRSSWRNKASLLWSPTHYTRSWSRCETHNLLISNRSGWRLEKVLHAIPRNRTLDAHQANWLQRNRNQTISWQCSNSSTSSPWFLSIFANSYHIIFQELLAVPPLAVQ